MQVTRPEYLVRAGNCRLNADGRWRKEILTHFELRKDRSKQYLLDKILAIEWHLDSTKWRRKRLAANPIAGRRMKILSFELILECEFGVKGDISRCHSTRSCQVAVFVIIATSQEVSTASLWFENDSRGCR
jgi:hypothetical protein